MQFRGLVVENYILFFIKLGQTHRNATLIGEAAFYWPLDELHNIRNVKGATWGSTEGNVSMVTRGVQGQALSCEGDASRISLGVLESTCLANLDTCSLGITLAIWLKYQGVAGEREQDILYTISGFSISAVKKDFYDVFSIRVNFPFYDTSFISQVMKQ